MWRALKRRYEYDSNLKPAQAFLLNHINSKIPLVIMYVDLVGSTDMSMTLPVDKLVSIIRAFTYEMSSVIQSHKGYVLKYIGDAVIAFFPSSYNKLLACDNAIYCAQDWLYHIASVEDIELPTTLASKSTYIFSADSSSNACCI